MVFENSIKNEAACEDMEKEENSHQVDTLLLAMILQTLVDNGWLIQEYKTQLKRS